MRQRWICRSQTFRMSNGLLIWIGSLWLARLLPDALDSVAVAVSGLGLTAFGYRIAAHFADRADAHNERLENQT